MNQVISNTELISFCRQMSMIFRSGISVLEGVELMLEDSGQENNNYRCMLENLKTYIEETGFFSYAVKETEQFPEYVVSMIELGEQTGNLDEVMDGLANYYEREENLYEDIKNACVYPLMMAGMMLVILCVLLVKVIPVFGQVYEQMGSRMTGFAAVLLTLGSGMREHALLLILLALACLTLVIWMFKSQRGKHAMKRTVIRYFRKNQLIYKTGLSRFAMIISMTLRSGMDYDTAFDMVRKYIGEHEELKKQIEECERLQKEGNSIGVSCQKSGLFSGMQARMIRISEQAGRSEEAFQIISQEIDEEISVSINNFIGKLEPTLVVILSVLVGIILLSVMMPLMGILSSIG